VYLITFYKEVKKIFVVLNFQKKIVILEQNSVQLVKSQREQIKREALKTRECFEKTHVTPSDRKFSGSQFFST
jgi:hypothetical protein